MAHPITVINKATHATTTVTGPALLLSERSVVKLPIPHTEIKSLARKGSDLMITTADGQVIVVHGFFVDSQTGHNDLVAQDNKGLWLSDLSALPDGGSLKETETSSAFSSVSSTDSLLEPLPAATGDMKTVSSAGIPAWVPVALAGAGLVATASGGSSASQSANDTPGTPPVVNTPLVITSHAQNPDGTLTVTGTAQPGDTVKVTYPDGSTATGTVHPDGHYSVTSPGVQTSGGISVVDIDSNGHSGAPVTQTWADTTAPQAPALNPVASGTNGAITITGTAEAGSTVTATFSDGGTGTAVADQNGAFSIPGGAHAASGTVTVTATDAAGNTGAPVTAQWNNSSIPSYSITIDSIDPDTGASASDFITITHNWEFKFYGKLGSPLGDGQKVQISLNGGQNWGDATVNGTEWYSQISIHVAPQPAGESYPHPPIDSTYAVQARIIDSTGAQLGSMATQTMVVDTTAPTITTTIDSSLYPASGTGYTLTGAISAALANGSASGVSAESVQISLDSGQTWHNATVSGTSWSYNLTSLPSSGNFTAQARVVDLAGNTGPTATQPVTGPNDGGSPSAITIGTVGPDTGVSSSDFITSPTKGALVISGSLNSPLPDGYTVQFKIANASGQVVTDVTSADHASNFVFMGQSFSFTPPATLPDGTYALTAVLYNASGKPQGSPANATLVVDTTAPTGTAALTAISHDMGISTSDFITNIASQTFSGTLSQALAAGAQSGVSAEMLMINLINQSSGQSVIGGPQAVNVNGLTWTYAPSFPLYDGTYTVQLQVKDAAGNAGALVSDSHQVVIDTRAPSVQITPVAGGNWFTFTATGGGLIFSGRYNGTLADGKQSGVSTERIEVNVGDGTGWHGATVNTAAHTWTLDYTGVTLTGSHNVQVRAADAAGNTASLVSNTITLPLDGGGHPATPAITAISPDTWVSDGHYGNGSDFITSLGTSAGHSLTVYGTLSGALATDRQLQVSTDGTHWSSAITPNSTGAWSYTLPSALPDGSYNLQARVVTTSTGETVSTAAAPHPLVIDSTAPTQIADMTDVKGVTSKDTVELNTLPGVGPGHWIVGEDSPDGIYSYTLSGTLSGALADGSTPGVTAEQLQVGVSPYGPNSWTWQTATIDPHGTAWSCPVTITLGVNTAVYDVALRVVDLAGNVKIESGSYELDQGIGTGGFLPAPDSAALAPQEASASNTLNLSLHDVLSDAGTLTGAGSAAAARQVTINSGGAVSAVHLVEGVGTGANQWQDTGTTSVNGVLYDLYHNTAQGANTAADLLIQHGIAVI